MEEQVKTPNGTVVAVGQQWRCTDKRRSLTIIVKSVSRGLSNGIARVTYDGLCKMPNGKVHVCERSMYVSRLTAHDHWELVPAASNSQSPVTPAVVPEVVVPPPPAPVFGDAAAT